MRKDKKVKNSKINLILIRSIGDVIQKNVEDESLLEKCFNVLEGYN